MMLKNKRLLRSIYMRSIFSGSRAGKTAKHHIKWWRDKPGHFTVERKSTITTVVVVVKMMDG